MWCDCEGGGTGSLAHKCVCCAVLEEVTWQDRAGKCVNSSRNKLGSRDCGKRASLQRALRFASLGAHRDRPMYFSMRGEDIFLGITNLCTSYIATIKCDRHWLVRL
jgi:hypothetical protein